MVLDYETLRVIWWGLLGVLLAGFAIMDGFDLGAVILLPFIAKNDGERRQVLNSIGPVWEGNQVWFILGGGAIFAAWPALYAVSFSAFYTAMFLLLVAFIFRPVGFKFRSKMPSVRWRNTWDMILFATGLIIALVLGVAVGNVLQGIPFYFDDSLRIFYTGHLWQLFNPFALLCGILSVSMLTLHGATYLAIKTSQPIEARAKKVSRVFALLTLLLFVLGGIWVSQYLLGFKLTQAVVHGGPSNPLNKSVVTSVGAWVKNYHYYPWMKIAPLMAILGSLIVIFFARMPKIAFLASSLTLFGIITTVGLSMFPFILPSTKEPGSSLLLWDSSSSALTLKIMLFAVVVFLPLILTYTSWVYYVLRGKVSEESLNQNINAY